MRKGIIGIIAIMAIAGAAWGLYPLFVGAHCDTMDGPVVVAAKLALEKADITPVLKWVKKEYENDIRTAFKKTLAVRDKGPDAKELADMYFFETLVRLHRAGEGAPYTGLKSSGTEIEPAVALSDKALETGSADNLIKAVTGHIAGGIKERFDRALKAKKRADESVETGREFVAAYVDFVHYVEGIHNAASAKGGHREETEQPNEPEHQHKH